MLEAGASQAVEAPSTNVVVQAPGSPLSVVFLKHSDFLYLKLPSGRVIAYAYPELAINTRTLKQADGTDRIVEKIAVRYMGWDGEKKLWCSMWTYGGLWAENITQALCRDFLTDGMLSLDTMRDLWLVLHVHDEAVSEAPEDYDITPKEYAEILMQPTRLKYPTLPIACKGWRGVRYGKH
jgi:DNA polymerase